MNESNIEKGNKNTKRLKYLVTEEDYEKLTWSETHRNDERHSALVHNVINNLLTQDIIRDNSDNRSHLTVYTIFNFLEAYKNKLIEQDVPAEERYGYLYNCGEKAILFMDKVDCEVTANNDASRHVFKYARSDGETEVIGGLYYELTDDGMKCEVVCEKLALEGTEFGDSDNNRLNGKEIYSMLTKTLLNNRLEILLSK